MAIRDILSNNASTGIVDFSGTGNPAGSPGLDAWAATIQQDQSVGSTTYMEVVITNSGGAAILQNIDFRYTDDSPATTTFNGSQVNIETKSTIDPGNLGNQIIDLRTRLPMVFPYNVDAEGGAEFAAVCVNPLDTFKYVFIHMNDDQGSNEGFIGSCLRGPLRFVAAPDAV